MPARKPDPRIRRRSLPGLLGRIETLAGYEVAERFALRFGGMELYIPVECPRDHAIAKAVGWRAARVICAELGGAGGQSAGAWLVPVGEIELKWNIVRRLRLAGLSRNRIVAEMRRRYRIVTSVQRVSELVRDLPSPPPAPTEAPRAAPVLPADPDLFEWSARR